MDKEKLIKAIVEKIARREHTKTQSDSIVIKTNDELKIEKLRKNIERINNGEIIL